MFNLDQILKSAVTIGTGEALPGYLDELAALGVSSYVTFVADGHTEYRGRDGYKVDSGPCHNFIKIAHEPNTDFFRLRLIFHQQGKLRSEIFCSDCGSSGVSKWEVDIATRSCTYFNRKGERMIVELIPVAASA